jgi:glycosyltransferase involved in cell wall biosynthesis
LNGQCTPAAWYHRRALVQTTSTPATPTGRLRIGFVLAELTGGGAERSMLAIIDAIDRTRFDPVLIVFEERVGHAVPDGVPMIVLPRGAGGGIGRLLSRVVALRSLIRRERLALVVSFLIGPNIVATLAARAAGVPVLIGERSAPRMVLSDANRALRLRGVWRQLIRWIYPLATGLIANTQGAKRELVALAGVRDAAVSVIANPIDLDRIRALAAEPLDPSVRWPEGPVLVHVGRLSHAKDHETLLRAFATLRARRPATLFLVGDGEDELRVRALAASLRLGDAVQFVGFTRNPYQYLARATISVLTSRFEGLPNALLEAMALGIPIVSTACEYGPIELLSGGDAGVLVPVGDADAVANAIDALLDAPDRRAALGARGRERAADFDRHRVARDYDALFERTARTRGVAHV